MTRRRKKMGIGLGVSLAGLLGAYYYQPQRIDFFPRPAPNPNPQVDPEVSHLFAPGTRVAVVAAHPDDPEFYIGGLLAKLSHAGAKITLVVCTDGDKGYYPPFMTDVAENRRVRRQEEREAAHSLGASVTLLAKPDGRLRADSELVGELVSVLNEFAPEYLLCFDPIYPPRLQHADHLNSGIAAEQAAKLVPSVRWICRFSTHAPNHVVDITKEWPEKRALLRIHRSQFANKIEFIERMVGDRARADGQRIGTVYGEGLRCEQIRP